LTNSLVGPQAIAQNPNNPLPVVYFQENFNSVTLGDSVNERLGFPRVTRVASDPDSAPILNVYSPTAPGWTVDNNFDNFGNFDLNYDPDASGFPSVGPPVGTIIGNTGMPNQGSADDGVDEWEGWSFVNKDFWVQAAGDQDRSLFTNGMGTVAVADPDEFDDLGAGRGGSYFNSGMSSAAINISGATTPLLTLNFDSSWRDESFDDDHTDNPILAAATEKSVNNQTAIIYATYNDSSNTRIVVPGGLWDSDSGDADPAVNRPASVTFKNDTPNENVSLTVPVVPGASEVTLTFALINGGNDWWWAVDNIDLSDQNSNNLYFEDFESVTLGPSVNERISTVPNKVTAVQTDTNTSPRPNSFTHTPPTGWTLDNSEIPTPPLGNNDDGVQEWEGWSFTTSEFWTFADKQRREEFTKGEGAFAVADGDEWDDLNNPDQGGSVLMKTVLESPEFSIPNGPQLYLRFDSSWRDEDANLAVITIDYGSGPVEILRWESDSASANFKDDAPNESILIPLTVPSGATTAKLAFRYEGGDDWWWAVDNIQVGSIPEPGVLSLGLLACATFAAARRRRAGC
jgi:hypothetical protein